MLKTIRLAFILGIILLFTPPVNSRAATPVLEEIGSAFQDVPFKADGVSVYGRLSHAFESDQYFFVASQDSETVVSLLVLSQHKDFNPILKIFDNRGLAVLNLKAGAPGKALSDPVLGERYRLLERAKVKFKKNNRYLISVMTFDKNTGSYLVQLGEQKITWGEKIFSRAYDKLILRFRDRTEYFGWSIFLLVAWSLFWFLQGAWQMMSDRRKYWFLALVVLHPLSGLMSPIYCWYYHHKFIWWWQNKS